MSRDQRRVPIRNMIYIADGPSDVPCFSIVNERGGKTLGVYQTEPKNNFRNV
ncbi:MAG: haloacid dehalogenase-like hydrolase, partial [Actinobacteria bacterium]|nr:haloacid dehalogenase-like hydrolase [Actinomycetota bacterium]NIV56721.1 haloacid dehalogenase-like hydrolase [Actinomycetota bacterium]NIV88242.1 haloacid dehalogenase-like hydrolase [Actinomycetota bacterium]